MNPGLVRCYECGGWGRLPEIPAEHREGCTQIPPRHCDQCDADWATDEPDPCFGRLPGVAFACCGHGREGYITFQNGRTIRFLVKS